MRGVKDRKKVHMDLSSSEFDGIVKLGKSSIVVPPDSVFRGILQANPENEMVLTFPSASQLIKSCPVIPCNGYCKRFSIRNDGTSGITLDVGEGGSIDGSAQISVSSHASHFCLRFTNVTSGIESYQLIRE